MSRLSNLVPFSTVVQIFLCLNCRLLVEIQEFVSGLCLNSDVFDWLDDLYIGPILCHIHSREMASIVGVTWKRRVFRNLS